MYTNISKLVTFPGESSAKKPINLAHEIDNNMIFQSCDWSFFFNRIQHVKYEIINIDANVNGGATHYRVRVLNGRGIHEKYQRKDTDHA